MTDQMPSFLSPQSNGGESVRHDRLSYKVQPNPHFSLKAGSSDISEPIEITELAMDLSNMNVGYVKWVGTSPSKLLNNALDSMPPKRFVCVLLKAIYFKHDSSPVLEIIKLLLPFFLLNPRLLYHLLYSTF